MLFTIDVVGLADAGKEVATFLAHGVSVFKAFTRNVTIEEYSTCHDEIKFL